MFARPAIAAGEIRQESVRGHFDFDACFFDFAETTVAFPPVAGRIQITVCLWFDNDAVALGLPIAPAALPAALEGGIRSVGIRRNFDGLAGPPGLFVSEITHPSLAEFLGA